MGPCLVGRKEVAGGVKVRRTVSVPLPQTSSPSAVMTLTHIREAERSYPVREFKSQGLST